MTPPPIPPHLAHLTVVRGYAAPYISSHHADGTAVLGAVDGQRTAEAFICRLCQICAWPLDRDRGASRIVVLARPQDIRRGEASEPGMHPECAAYTLAACPMVNGRMAQYRATAHPNTCTDTECACHERWIREAPSGRDGAQADRWYTVWMTSGQYGPAIPADSQHHVTPLVGGRFVRIRPVSVTGATAAEADVLRREAEVVDGIRRLLLG
ncbi:MAG: hypothetical protein HOV68_13100 [Streptomycetaceae bacterium]|nr:hypothetical protein [Streptomycetaceae bacterium]